MRSFLLSMACICLSAYVHAQIKQIEKSTNQDFRLSKAEWHAYELPMQKGQYVSFTVQQKTVDVAIDLISPTGNKIKTYDSPNGTSEPEQVTFAAEVNGIYTLKIYPIIESEPGTLDSATRAMVAELNQGIYQITGFERFNEKVYQEKLAKIANDKKDFQKLLLENAHELKTVDPGNGFADLQPFKQILQNVQVLGLGESSHGTSEFFRMKHRMLEFLVKEMGYTSFYIEASMLRCQYINDYVLYSKGNLDTATAIQGFTTWRVEEMRNMIEWMRLYNKQVTAGKKVSFKGFDLQINDRAWPKLDAFFKIVNPTRLSLLDSLKQQISKAGVYARNIISDSAQKECKRLYSISKTSCQDILSEMQLHPEQYSTLTSKEEYEQMKQCVTLLIQEIDSYKEGFNELRDYYMAENIMWLLRHENPGTKVIVWAHNMHIEKYNSKEYHSMGHFLNTYLHNTYYVLGLEFYAGSFQSRNADISNNSKDWDIISIGAPVKESLPWYLNTVNKPFYYINFRHSNIAKSTLFTKFLDSHTLGSFYSPKSGISTTPDKWENFDGFIFIKNSTPSKNFKKVYSN